MTWRTDAERAATLGRCAAILERRGSSAVAVLRVLASLRPRQPRPTAEERVVERSKGRRFVAGNGQRLMPLRPAPKTPPRIDTARASR